MYSCPGYTCLPPDTRIAGPVLGGLDDSTRLVLFAQCVAFFHGDGEGGIIRVWFWQRDSVRRGILSSRSSVGLRKKIDRQPLMLTVLVVFFSFLPGR